MKNVVKIKSNLFFLLLIAINCTANNSNLSNLEIESLSSSNQNGQYDQENSIELTDTIKKYDKKKVYRSAIFDSIFRINDGFYVDYYGSISQDNSNRFMIISKENINTNKVLAVLAEEKGEQYFITDTFSFYKPFRSGFTVEKSISQNLYVDYISIGNYIKNNGVFFLPDSMMIEESDVSDGIWKYKPDRVYGITKAGKLELLKNSLWKKASLDEIFHQINDTIFFENPMP